MSGACAPEWHSVHSSSISHILLHTSSPHILTVLNSHSYVSFHAHLINGVGDFQFHVRSSYSFFRCCHTRFIGAVAGILRRNFPSTASFHCHHFFLATNEVPLGVATIPEVHFPYALPLLTLKFQLKIPNNFGFHFRIVLSDDYSGNCRHYLFIVSAKLNIRFVLRRLSREMFTFLHCCCLWFTFSADVLQLETRSQWFPALLSWPCCVACCTRSSRAGETKWVNHKTQIIFA